MTIFRRKGEGSGPSKKKSLSEKTEGVKNRGRGRGGLRILTKSKKIQVFFIDASPYGDDNGDNDKDHVDDNDDDVNYNDQARGARVGGAD